MEASERPERRWTARTMPEKSCPAASPLMNSAYICAARYRPGHRTTEVAQIAQEEITMTVGPDEGDARPELVVLVGLQASGKSTFYAHRFSGTHALVSKDLFRRARHRQRRQMRLVEEALTEGVPVVVDNTNPSPHEWAPLVAAGRAYDARVVAYWFPPDVKDALARNAARQGPERVPDIGVYATLKRLRRPRRADGFDAVYEVRFDGHGGFLVAPAEERPATGVIPRGPGA
ncbi:ATP-binding protein [Streptomyces triculaminicus]|nr:ATP-binding protein [Streptomyces triculaminicus]